MSTGDIAVIGMACRLPGARTPEEFWTNLAGGVESIGEVEAADLAAAGLDPDLARRDGYVGACSALDGIEEFDAAFFGFVPREAALLDPQQRVFLEIVWEALEDAGRPPAAAPVTGVFCGCNAPSYLMSNLVPGGPLLPGGEAFDVLIHNDKDYLATRTAYRLGLTGPAVTVQTACSTSLVAVHLACQSILDGECELAVAGGVSIRVPQRTGYLHEEGLVFSPDGHCRPFDADAAGTVFGNGAGVVVLKDFDRAVEDGDRIEAVIRGSAVNNDGAAKAGFTAPGVDGQTEVISAALAVADVDAATVTAVEAHGTGTPLGDPIEITALTRAFRDYTAETGYCAIGSVKSNVGHLDTAAGITGLLKAILQLRHRRLAPSLHFRRPSPHIDFDKSPFWVVTEETAWDAPGPLRIGVSSFGIGGTNAHVVLEEPSPAELRPEPYPPRPAQIVVASARTPDAARTAADRTAVAVAAARDTGVLADIAGTTQSGRRHFRYRRFAVGTDGPGLSADLPGPVFDAGEAEPRVVFLFPGQGSQYAGMARGLYESERVFRDEVDACAEVLRDVADLDLLGPLYGGDGDLTATGLAQPALFTVGYALVRLFASWGVRPDAMAGHSVGELLAACVAGVLSRDDALRAVAARGRLMQRCPPGAMLSVGTAADAVRPLLTGGLSLAAVNGPELCVVSGPAEEVEAFAAGLDVPHRTLHTSHAFHSAMMDAAVAPFADELRGMYLSSPRLPFVSNVTGTLITDEQARDPAYWGRQLRAPVLFADGLRTVAGDGRTVLVEMGPGDVLGRLARHGLDPSGRTVVTSTVPGPDGDGDGHGDDVSTALTGLARAWAAGVEVDWERLRGGPFRRVSLPTYPFQRRRYWVDPVPHGGGPVSGGLAARLDLPPADTLSADDAADLREGLSTAYVAPRDETEERVVALWQEFLGRGPIGVHDDFFELGGHSLAAARLAARLRDELGVPVALRTLMRHPTVAGMLAHAGDAEPDTAPPDALPEIVPDPAARYEPFPLTEMQQAQWLGRSAVFEGGDVAAHVYLETEGRDLDLGRLARSWQRLVDHHDMLRMVVLPDATQRVLPPPLTYTPEVMDLRNEPDPEAVLAAVRTRMRAQVRPADEWPLWELRLALLPDGRVRALLSFDLLVADVASLFFGLLPDWRRAYESPDEETGGLEPLTLTFRDYVLAETALHDTPGYERSLDYWRERVRALPPAPRLPTVRADADDTEFDRYTARFARDTWDRVKSRAAAHGLTPSVTLAAAYASVLATWSASQRFTVNATAVNRLPLHPEVGALVGEFASFGLLEVDAAAPATFRDLATAMQERSWTDMEHRLVSGVRVLRELARVRGGVRDAMMPVVFTSALAREGTDSPFAWLGDIVHTISQTPQVTLDCFVVEAEGQLDVSWHVLGALFPDGMVADMFRAFTALVEGLAGDDGWTAPAAAPAPEEHLRLRAEANDTAGPVPDGLLHDPLLRQAAERPDAPAVIAEDRTLTFAELRGRAAALATALREGGVGPGSPVAIGVRKGWRQVVAVLGVALAGGAYVPVDPDLPVERRAWLLRESGAACLVVPFGSPQGADVPVVEIPEDADWRTAEPTSVPRDPGDVAYILYTSGSTGTPKGVAVSHRAALNTCVDIVERFAIGPDDRAFGLSSLSFDLSVFDIFGVLGAGGALVLPGPDARTDAAAWTRMVVRHQVTVWNTVPGLAEMLVEQASADAVDLPLQLALLSGDWIPVSLPDRLRALAPDAWVVSLGGATEAGIWSIAYPIERVDAGWESIPYGRPLRNQWFEVLNERFEPCPTWVTGELFIGGVGLAEGYWRDPERTDLQFVTHPGDGRRLYRTGDLGRYLPDGTIQFLGRHDHQVKVGGHRIELGEIEHTLERHPDVRRAVVTATGDRSHRRLTAYAVPDGAVDPDELREHLARWLPAYMVPRDVVLLDALPLTANGKVDRAALPRAETRSADAAGLAAELDPDQRALAERMAAIVAQVLRLDHVDPDQNFFTLGGDSILGVQVIARVTAEGIDVTPQDLFAHQSIAELVLALAAEGRLTSGPVPDADGGDLASVPLTSGQRAVLGGAVPATGRLVLDLAGEPDMARLEQAMARVVARHDALRLRIDEATGTQHATEPGDVTLPELDLTALPPDRRADAADRMADEMADEIDPRTSPPTKAAVIRVGEDTSRLVWVAHRAAVDARSWRTLVTDLEAACTGPLDGPAPSFLRWASGRPEPEADEVAAAPPTATAGGDLVSTCFELSPEETARFRTDLETAYRLRLGDGLLAALAWALCADARHGDARVVAEAPLGGDGVGCHIAPRRLALRADDAETALAAVKDARPGSGPPTAVLTEVDDGSWTDDRPGDGPFRVPDDFAGPETPFPAGATLLVRAAVVQGALRVRCTHPTDPRGTVPLAVAALADRLRAVAAHCAAPETGVVTPGDFPLADLDTDDLADLLADDADEADDPSRR
ncbi:amino acid adenylation domain-containing protein [Actinomadura pelletieri DSM 43383]|uniref:Phenyloxazoline synthase MbtB n=1 Tax=Actinomadura pelletieri DSM 43383 TaxID=1120940 RepID=A0A495QU19_9ACTN|nr:non-ribosomal peptide synthetase/type I polyketide synthase [Actinomadura pelletieri]RKS76989.1 amino acid adenylation domain-containing protein [Actinomadura pelletieri DSM 43383]